jgi:gas vesicle protein
VLSDTNLLTAFIGGAIGGVLGVVGTLVSSYYGPRKIEEWREKTKEEKFNGPRKRLLMQMLKDSKFPNGRTIETLSKVTGTEKTECRRLLIEIGARGTLLKDEKEGWTFKPITDE